VAGEGKAVRMNSDMALLWTVDSSLALRKREVPEPLLSVLAEEWVLGYRDAQLLRALSSGYRPDDSDSFVDVVQFESAVNGRGMTDWDLPWDGRERGVRLVRRSLAYACAALRVVPESFSWPVFGYVGDIESYAREALLEISQEDAVRLMPGDDGR
jgi:hypothetical protein